MQQDENRGLDGLIIDNFAGGGGASTGIELATGRPVDYAINHDPDSIAMHKANHPMTIHLCEDVFKVDPAKLCAGRPVLLCWFSPDCKHFSKAKGGKPRSKKIRGLAWVAVRWAATVKPRVIILENVEEFQTWGPLDENGYPIKEKAGSTFRKFVSEIRNKGYEVDYRELVAADYGAPTKRKRFFLIARCDGKRIVWPKPEFFERSKAKPGQKVWRSAASIIDFSLPTKSIFNRERDLAEPTKRRIGRGLEKFVLKSANPFIIPVGYGEGKNQKPRVNDIKEPVSTVVSSVKQNVVIPYLQDARYMKDGKRRLLDMADPNQTIAAGGNHTEMCEAMIAPFMGVSNFTDPGRNCQEPLATVTAANKEALLSPRMVPFISQNFGGTYKGAGSDIENSLPAITQMDHNRLIEAKVSPFLALIGENGFQRFRDSSVEDPLKTIVTKQEHLQVSPLLMPYIGINNFTNKGFSVESPLPTVTTAPGKNVVIAPVITDYKFSNSGGRADSPLPTETAVRSHYVTSSFLQEYYGNGYESKAGEPLPTVTSKDRHGLVSVKIEECSSFEGMGNWPLVRSFINSYTSVQVPEGKILLLTVSGRDYFISDIGMRMLTPRELYDAQGFPHDYVIDRDFTGKPYPASKQVARCGNAVPPPFAEALVRANIPDQCHRGAIGTMERLLKEQDRFARNRTPFNGVSRDGSTSLLDTDFEILTQQVAQERMGSPMGGGMRR